MWQLGVERWWFFFLKSILLYVVSFYASQALFWCIVHTSTWIQWKVITFFHVTCIMKITSDCQVNYAHYLSQNFYFSHLSTGEALYINNMRRVFGKYCLCILSEPIGWPRFLSNNGHCLKITIISDQNLYFFHSHRVWCSNLECCHLK